MTTRQQANSCSLTAAHDGNRFYGMDSVGFTVTDVYNNSASTTAVVTVQPPPPPPPPSPPSPPPVR
jgi:hypothetical protein